jgi:ribonuclease D
LTDLSRQVSVPTETLLSPDLVRRLCWDWQVGPDSDADTTAAADAFLCDAGARAWQRALVVPVLAPALNPPS